VIQKSREEILNYTEAVIERDLIEQVDRLYNLMGFAYDLNYNCYYGYKEFFNY